MHEKTILVAGGAGFIGSHLCQNLLNLQCNVICMDNLSSGQYRNIEALNKFNNFQFIEHDVTQPINESQFQKIDEIYNLACPASPIHYQNTPIQTTLSSVLGSYNLLNLAKVFKTKYLLSSTSEIYGDPLEHPQTESYNGNASCTGIRSCYVEGKRCAESLSFDYKRQYKLNIKVARIFNTYGPNMKTDDGRVISNFIMNALNNDIITINGDGQQTRSFCYIDDLVEALVLLMKSEHSGPINLGSPIEISIKGLGHKISTMVGSNNQVHYSHALSDDPKLRQPNIQLAKENLNWEPRTSLDEGLKKTITYFRDIN